MKNILCALFLLAVTACGNGPSPPGPPTPPPVGRPGTQQFTADFSQPDFKVGQYCLGTVPVNCTTLPPQYIYGAFGDPYSAICATPGPNTCYSVTGGVLHITATGPVPFVTRQTFSIAGTISEQIISNAACTAPDCFGGVVVYNGDWVTPYGDLATGQWRALYFSQGTRAGYVAVKVWGPTHVQDLNIQVPAGTPVTLRIDYTNGVWVYYVNAQTWTESAANPWSTDPLVLSNPPTAALFMGDINLDVTQWNVYDTVN